jgi:hypothetical protein
MQGCSADAGQELLASLDQHQGQNQLFDSRGGLEFGQEFHIWHRTAHRRSRKVLSSSPNMV